MTLTLNTHTPLLTSLLSASAKFQVSGCNTFQNTHCFQLFTCKSLCFQNYPCRNIGQGHPRVIILTNYDGLESPILHTKFCGNWPTGSREEYFWSFFFTYMSVVAILVMWPRYREQSFHATTKGGSTKNFNLIGQAVSEKKIFEIVIQF